MSAQLGPAMPQRLIADRYALLDELGRGGMGVVWRAEDRVIGRHVAVKELRLPEGVSAREREVFQERVLREARTAGRLNDPAVVTVFDVVNTDGATFLVMELIEAPTLSDLVRDNGPMPADRVAGLGEQLLTALEAAHAAGVVHRDVKPSNIMVAPNGRVKLTDFGIAQAVDDPKLTTSGMLVGSPGYMAPDRVRGGEATPATDLWAVGAVMAFAAEGRAPYERPTTAATLHAIMNETPRLTRVQGRLASVIQGLLIADPAARLTGAQARALLHVPTGEPDATGLVTPAHGQTTAFIPNGQPGMPVLPGQPWPTAPLSRPPARTGLRVFVAVLAVLVGAGLAVGGYLVGHNGSSATGGTNPPPAMVATLTYGSPDADLATFDLSNGACAKGQVKAGNHFTSDDLVDCATTHSFLVFYAGDGLNSSVLHLPYQGRALAASAEADCTLIFESAWITDPNKDNDLNYVALIPSAAAWKVDPATSGGTRQVDCVLWRRDSTSLSKSVIATDNS